MIYIIFENLIITKKEENEEWKKGEKENGIGGKERKNKKQVIGCRPEKSLQFTKPVVSRCHSERPEGAKNLTPLNKKV